MRLVFAQASNPIDDDEPLPYRFAPGHDHFFFLFYHSALFESICRFNIIETKLLGTHTVTRTEFGDQLKNLGAKRPDDFLFQARAPPNSAPRIDALPTS